MEKEEYWLELQKIRKNPENWAKKLWALELPEEYSRKLELTDEPEAHLNTDLPIWVRNLRLKLNNTIFKPFQFLLEAEPDDLNASGYAIGLARPIKEKLFEKLDELTKLTGLEFTADDRAEFDKEYAELEEFKKEKDIEVENSTTDKASEYYGGVSEGMKSLWDKDGQIKGKKLDTDLALYMMMTWPWIEDVIRNRNQMHQVFVDIFGKRRTGSLKRVHRFLERIQFSPAKRGRPRKK
jgi:hypothetical protein